jgi:hypothetical protein
VFERLQPANGEETKEVAMRQGFKVLVVLSAAIAVGILSYSAHVWATSASGFTSSTIAKGTLGAFEVFNHAIIPNPNGDGDNDRDDKLLWLSMQKTKGPSDLYVQSNTWLGVNLTTGAIASTGWHSHPGASLIIVTSGTITDYESDDPACKPQMYTQGMSFVDSGGSHTHIVRNEGTVPASAIAVQLIPAGATRRIDAASVPPNCPNIQ